MENPRKHDKKKNLKTLPLAINIGAGRFGVGGILLVGGALVTATIVSAFAFKARSQRRSSSENMKKGVSPSPETLSVDVPNNLELLMNTNKDSCVGSLSLEVQNQSDEVTTKKEIQTNSIQGLTQDENHEYLPAGDSNKDIMVSSVGEDEENTCVHDDSAFESEEVDNSYEKIDTNCEEQVIVAAQIEEDSSLKRDEELLGNENDERVDADSSVSDVGSLPLEVQKQNQSSDEVTTRKEIQTNSIQSLTQDENHEYLPAGDSNEDIMVSSVGKDEENTSVHDYSAFESEKLDNSYEKIDMDCEEQVTVAAQIEEDSSLKRDEELPGNENDERVDADSSVSDDKGVAFIEEYYAVEAPIKEDIVSEASVNENEEGEDHQERVVMEEEMIKAACVNLVNKEDISKMADDEAAAPDAEEMHKVCETFVVECVMNRLKEAVDDQTTDKQDAPPSQSMNKEEKDKETTQNVEEPMTIEDELLIKAAKVDDQTHNLPSELINKDEKEEETDVQDEVETVTEQELVNKDEIPHVQSVKEDEDEKDNVVEMWQDQTAEEKEDELVKKDEVPQVKSMKEDENTEELSPEAKISNHKTEENEEKRTSLGEKQAFAASESWNVKLMIWSVLISVWCLCHWYSEQPCLELSLVGSLLFILILLGYRNRATYLVKYE